MSDGVIVSMRLSPKKAGALYMKSLKQEERIEALEEALTLAHSILLHEMDNGRTPTQLQGVGLGYFEDVIAGLDAEKRHP